MRLTIRVKQPGRKHALIDNKIVIVEDIDDAKLAEVVSKVLLLAKEKDIQTLQF